MKTRTFPQPPAPPPIVADDSANGLQIHFFIDPAQGPSVCVDFVDANGIKLAGASYPLSAYTTITNPQKLALRATLLAIRDETFAKEGYA
jgi:hypothetical protein